jgi:serine/threonine protein kinase
MEYGGKPLAGPAAVEEVLRSDLKPANILVTKTGVKLLDFGLAKLGRGRDSARADATVTQALTQENAIVGTLPYMAPEQLQGKEADPRSGIFSFRCALCEILTGKRAFEGANTASAITAGCTARIPKRK